ncbi:M56 family metallopeptidase [Zhihengliuella sp.]|uniref:M56 family metallopeptidase n=1 Tax=Zhihengliuella sp. TaxID=1954483 RepID=UPI0028118572|nr:M56 family metallopeptidase [Zhihengliuella sp.]
MLLTSYLLAGLAIALAWPVPVWLSKAEFVARAPIATLILWQAIALAGGLSMIGAFALWGLAPLGDSLVASLVEFWRVVSGRTSADGLGALHLFALSTAALLGVHLVFTLLLTWIRVHRHRIRHRRLLSLLSNPSPTIPRTVVVQHDTPVAYCVPGVTSAVTVVSRGLMDALDDDGLAAVLAHERAHLEQRHDLLLLAFESWHQALPWLPTSRLARSAVHELIEMLADDAALQQVPRQTLLRAVVTAATGESPVAGAEAALPEGGLSTHRLKRLITAPVPLPRAAVAGLASASALLVLVPTGLVLVQAVLD